MVHQRCEALGSGLGLLLRRNLIPRRSICSLHPWPVAFRASRAHCRDADLAGTVLYCPDAWGWLHGSLFRAWCRGQRFCSACTSISAGRFELAHAVWVRGKTRDATNRGFPIFGHFEGRATSFVGSEVSGTKLRNKTCILCLLHGTARTHGVLHTEYLRCNFRLVLYQPRNCLINLTLTKMQIFSVYLLSTETNVSMKQNRDEDE